MCVVFENHGTTTLRNKMDFYYNKDIYTISSLRSLNDIIILFTQLADIIAYIHSVNIVHNDLKPENIVWGDDDKIYLIDFGSAAFSNITGSTTRSRTTSYAGSAPEILKNIKINKEDERYVDIWSFGIIMLDAIIGLVILDESNNPEIEEMLINDTWDLNMMLGNYFSEYPKLMELWDVVPDDLKMIILQCLSLNPSDRPKMNELLLDDKFNKILNTKTTVVQNTQQLDVISKMQLKIDKLEKIIADRPKSFKMVNKLTSHTGIINTIIYSPCGNYIASGSNDTTIRIWDITNNKLFQLLDEQHNPISCLSYSPSGMFLVCGTSNGIEDSKIIIREKMENNYFRIIQTLVFPDSKINSISYSPCGNYISFIINQILDSKNFLHIIKRSGDFTFNKFKELKLSDYESKHLNYSPCGNYLILENAILRNYGDCDFNLIKNTYVEKEKNVKSNIDILCNCEFVKNIYNKLPSGAPTSGGGFDISIFKEAYVDFSKLIIIIKRLLENPYDFSTLLSSYYQIINIDIIINVIKIKKEHRRVVVDYNPNAYNNMCGLFHYGKHYEFNNRHLYVSDEDFERIITEYDKFHNQLKNIFKQIENPSDSKHPIIVKFSPCGNYTVSIIDGGSNIEIKEKIGDEFNLIQSIVNEDTNKINYLVYSPCGNYLMTTTISSIKIYKKMYDNTFDIYQLLVGHNNNCVCYSQCGNYFIIGSNDNTIRIYNNI
jgi:serine/threonine protein kinase